MPEKSLHTKLEIHNSEPLYKQVEARILACLEHGEWKPGEQLPTEPQLADRFGVAVFTIRAGISELVKSNILVRKQGKGTFVARHTRQRQRYQFSHVFQADGTQIFPDRQLLGFEKESPTEELARLFALRDGARQGIFRISCLLTLDQEPAGLMDIALPAPRFQDLSAKALREGTENLYAVYQDVCGVNVISVNERVYAEMAKTPVARALKVPAGTPLLRIERIAYTYNNAPVEYRIRYFSALTYHYRCEEGGV